MSLIEQTVEWGDRHSSGFKINVTDDIGQRRDEKFLPLPLHDIDIVAAGLNDLFQRTKFDTIVGNDVESDKIGPVVFILIRFRKLVAPGHQLATNQSERLSDACVILDREECLPAVSLQSDYSKSLLSAITMSEDNFGGGSQSTVITGIEVNLHHPLDAVSSGDLADDQQFR